jgi:hypothetical protein
MPPTVIVNVVPQNQPTVNSLAIGTLFKKGDGDVCLRVGDAYVNLKSFEVSERGTSNFMYARVTAILGTLQINA